MKKNELNSVLSELNAIRNELSAEQSEQHLLKNELNSALSELNTIRNELSVAHSELNTIRNELSKVYNSRSYRITAPLRAILGFGRVQREHFLQLRSRLALKTRARNQLRKTVYLFQRIPMVAVFVEKFKYRFPRTWRKISIMVKRMIFPPQQPVVIASGSSEEESHFLNLFHREIMKRR